MENTTVIVSRYGTIKPPGSSLPALTVVAKVDPAMPEVVEEEQEVVDKRVLEAVNFEMGRAYAFILGPSRDDVSAEELVDKMIVASPEENGQSRVLVPGNLKIDFEKALRGRFMSRRRQESRKLGRVAIRIKNEYFFRPLLTRSLSLP